MGVSDGMMNVGSAQPSGSQALRTEGGGLEAT